MSASSATRLYSPEVLALATSLANFAMEPDLPLVGSARSPACGSSLQIGLSLDPSGAIQRIGLRVQACAIGQAAAAIFASGASGATRVGVVDALTAMQNWLAGNDPMPGWPGLGAIAPARDYPARHGAMLLPWKAALEALPTA